MPDEPKTNTVVEHEEDEQMVAAAWPANVKRTYEEYQDLALTAARRSQSNFDQLNNVALQAMQNAVTTADMVAKQAIKHSDIAATTNLGVGVAAESVAAVITKSLDANNTVLMKSLDATISPLVAILTEMVVALRQSPPKA
jgi:hypothetical protein